MRHITMNYGKGQYTNEKAISDEQSNHQRNRPGFLPGFSYFCIHRRPLHRRMGACLLQMVSDHDFSLSSGHRLFQDRQSAQRHAERRCLRSGLFCFYGGIKGRIKSQYPGRLFSRSSSLLLRSQPAEYAAVLSGSVYLSASQTAGL